MAYKRNVEIFEEAYEKKDAKSVVSYVARDGRKRYIAGNKNPDGGGTPMPSGGGMTEVTWQELKDKRDAGKLTPGSLYRITDYQCTTTQENTQSAGHQFDIVLLALSENKLAEEGWAMMHPTDVYDVTFSDGVTLKCYLYNFDAYNNYNVVRVDNHIGITFIPLDALTIDEENKTVIIDGRSSTDLEQEDLPYNYFQNSNLSAWKVWYCLDNDTARFAWADDSVDEGSPASITVHNNKAGDGVCIRNTEEDIENFYAWTHAVLGTFWTDTLTPTVEDNVYNGLGEIRSTWSITSYTPAHEGTGLPNGRGVIYRLIDEFNNDVPYDFKNIQFIRPLTDGVYDADNGEDVLCYTFTWIDENNETKDASIFCQNIAADEGFVYGVHDNSMLPCIEYDFYSEEHSDKLAFALNDNVFISSYQYDDGCFYGIYGNHFGSSCYSNTFGNNCGGNTFGNSCGRNTFGNSCGRNTFGNNCGRNTFGNGCDGNTFGNYCTNNTFGNGCGGNTFGNMFQSNTFGNNCYNNTFGNNCARNTFGNNFLSSSIGDNVNNVKVNKDYVQFILIENGNQFITITSTATTSSTFRLENFAIALGTNNSNSGKTISHNTTNDTFKTTYQNSNSTTKNV